MNNTCQFDKPNQEPKSSIPTNAKDAVQDEIQRLAKTPEQYRAINTFMKRRTHISNKAEQALTDATFASHLVNHDGEIGKLGDVSHIHDLRGLFADSLNGRHAPLTLEIGFGMGTSLITMAKNSPHINFVGIEVHEPGIGNCVYDAHCLGLTNLKIINGDAIALLKALPKAHIDTIQLYFPDPWQKKRHYKRRFVTQERMALVAHALTVGGVFHAATDWEHYAYWMLDVLDNMSEFVNMAGMGNFSPRPTHRPITKFENRGIDSGHGVWDLLYKKL